MFSGFGFIFSMSRYVPVSTKMDSEDHYHSPYDTNDLDSDVSFSPRYFMKFRFCTPICTCICIFHNYTFLFWKRRLIMKRLAAWSGILRAAFSFPRVNSNNLIIISKIIFYPLRNNYYDHKDQILLLITIDKGTDPSPGEKTLPLESRLRYNAYSPHHTIRQVNNSTIMMMMRMVKNVVCCN